jgi:hypothetical protein
VLHCGAWQNFAVIIRKSCQQPQPAAAACGSALPFAQSPCNVGLKQIMAPFGEQGLSRGKPVLKPEAVMALGADTLASTSTINYHPSTALRSAARLGPCP